jgi:hypothetical protein
VHSLLQSPAVSARGTAHRTTLRGTDRFDDGGHRPPAGHAMACRPNKSLPEQIYVIAGIAQSDDGDGECILITQVIRPPNGRWRMAALLGGYAARAASGTAGIAP